MIKTWFIFIYPQNVFECHFLLLLLCMISSYNTYNIDIVVYKTYICLVYVRTMNVLFHEKKALQLDLYPLNKIYTQLISVDYKSSSFQNKFKFKNIQLNKNIIIESAIK